MVHDMNTIWQAREHRRSAQAMEAAQEQNDAQDGKELIAQLEDKWFAEGVECFENGDSIEALWNNTQRTGWKYAEGQALNSGVFEHFNGMSEGEFLSLLVDALRDGRVMTAVQFNDADHDMMVVGP